MLGFNGSDPLSKRLGANARTLLLSIGRQCVDAAGESALSRRACRAVRRHCGGVVVAIASDRSRVCATEPSKGLGVDVAIFASFAEFLFLFNLSNGRMGKHTMYVGGKPRELPFSVK